jgi:hypothetical protein
MVRPGVVLGPSSTLGNTVSSHSKIAERLHAHARLCRQIASQSAHDDERMALEEMARDCDREAEKTAHFAPTAK